MSDVLERHTIPMQQSELFPILSAALLADVTIIVSLPGTPETEEALLRWHPDALRREQEHNRQWAPKPGDGSDSYDRHIRHMRMLSSALRATWTYTRGLDRIILHLTPPTGTPRDKKKLAFFNEVAAQTGLLDETTLADE